MRRDFRRVRWIEKRVANTIFMKTPTKSVPIRKREQARFHCQVSDRTLAGLRGILLAASLALGLPCATLAAGLAESDQAFLLAAAQGGMAEVKLGNLAIRNAVREDVKDFGRKMVKDHTAINDDLKALASLKGVTLAESLDSKHQAEVDKIAALTGIKFDDAYIAAMVKDHKMDAKDFETESAETKDPEIKGFLNKAIPIVNAHLSQITVIKQIPAAGEEPDR